MLAVVGPVGSGCSRVIHILKDLPEHDFGYEASIHTLSEVITSSLPLLGDAAPSVGVGIKRVEDLQAAGNALRKRFGHEYLAAKTIERIARWRAEKGMQKSGGGEDVPRSVRHVHLIDSLKNPAELKVFRETYGDMFWLFGVFAPEAVRRLRLTKQKGYNEADLALVIRNDYNEREPHGQSVRDTFHQADFFVRNDQPNDTRLKLLMLRNLEVLFGAAIQTLTLDEASMYAAYAEAAGSACMSRQVGAAIVSEKGEVIGLGKNDVPRYGGGLYTSESGDADHRCFRWANKICHNDDRKAHLYGELWRQLNDDGLLMAGVDSVRAASSMATTELKQLIEFSRAVHAEMEAVISVARGGKHGLLGSTLYCTTYPCHSCARHILAAGVKRVVYIEPYPKSLAMTLHYDAVSESEEDDGKKLVFLQYSGVAPKHMLRLFKASRPRKDSDGRCIVLPRKTVIPLLAVSLDDYATHEKYVVARLAQSEAEKKGNAQPKLV